MKTNETQTSTPHQSIATKPFLGAQRDQSFFSTQRAPATPFFQPPASATIQAKSGTDKAKDVSESDVQRMPAFASEVMTEGTVQRSPSPQSLSTFPIQAKLTIGPVGDRYEQQADRVAAQVVDQIHAPATTQSLPGQSVQRMEEKPEELQAKPEITTLQRMEEKPEELQAKPEITTLQRIEEKPEELRAKSMLQRQGMAGGEATPDLDTSINRARGGGQPLDASLQRSMGQAMGADFSGVKVHTDAQADQLNRSLQAKAFTTGQDVFFRQGAYEPGSRGGQELIAHELTHVVQQNAGAVQRSSVTLHLPGEHLTTEGQEIIENKQQPQPIQQTTENRTVTSQSHQSNKTGMPDALKGGIENLSGSSLDNVRVHYNSPKPAQVQALAYTQGSDIHVAPGQEEHLPHEAWHVVQQAQGRVQPTMQMNDGESVNDDAGLEREADVMGAKAAQMPQPSPAATGSPQPTASSMQSVAQRQREGVGTGKGIEVSGNNGTLNFLSTPYNGLTNEPAPKSSVAESGVKQFVLDPKLVVLAALAGVSIIAVSTMVAVKGWTWTKLYLLSKIMGYNLHFTIDDLVPLGLVLDGRDVIHLGRIANPGITIANITQLVQKLLDTSGQSVYELMNALDPLTYAQVTPLIDALSVDGMNGQEMRDLVVPLRAAGTLPPNIVTMITGMRGNLQALAPGGNNPASRSETDVPPILGPGLVPAQAPGSKILSATEIKTHMDETIAAGRAANTIDQNYPTGQVIAGRTIDQLWTDCSIAAITHNDVNTGTPETPAQKQIRQKMALHQLIATNPARAVIIQRIFAEQEGQHPRTAFTAATEDSYGAGAGAHIMARHVFGPPPPIETIRDLALRVTRHIGGACPGKAGAFNTTTDAQNGMNAALTAADVGGRWTVWRNTLTQGNVIDEDVVAASVGTILDKGGPGKVAAANMPAHAHAFGVGNTMPLYPGDPGGASLVLADGGAMIVPAGAPLTNIVPPTIVHLRIIGDANTPGGFFIHSAWPA